MRLQSRCDLVQSRLPRNSALLQARYDELLGDLPGPNAPTPPTEPTIEPGLCSLAAAFDQFEQTLRDGLECGAPAECVSNGSIYDVDSHDELAEAVCDPLTALLDPDWPRSLPPPKLTIGVVREFFHSEHPATATMPRSVYEGIGLSPRGPTFPLVSVVHVCLASRFMQLVSLSSPSPGGLELTRAAQGPEYVDRRMREAGVAQYWGREEHAHLWHTERARVSDRN